MLTLLLAVAAAVAYPENVVQECRKQGGEIQEGLSFGAIATRTVMDAHGMKEMPLAYCRIPYHVLAMPVLASRKMDGVLLVVISVDYERGLTLRHLAAVLAHEVGHWVIPDPHADTGRLPPPHEVFDQDCKVDAWAASVVGRRDMEEALEAAHKVVARTLRAAEKYNRANARERIRRLRTAVPAP